MRVEMRSRRVRGMILALVIALALAACTTAPLPSPLVQGRLAPTATPGPPTATPPPPTPTPLPPTATPTTQVVRSTPTAARAAAQPSVTPTAQWPATLVISESDIEQGASAVPGLEVTGLEVDFANGVMAMRFDSLRYSFVSLRNVTIEGRFVANNGDVTFVADRISPRNLATSAIPGFINQSLDQQLAGWYVEAVEIVPGQLVATVRPRS